MANEFSITAATSRLTLDSNRRGAATVTVANATNRPIPGRVHLMVSGGGKAEWFTVQTDTTYNFAVAEARQYTIQSAVPAAAPSGEYTVRINMVGVRNPDEEYSEGPALLVVVPAAPVAATIYKRYPWLYVLLALALIAVLVVGYLLMSRRPPTVTAVTVPEVSGQQATDAEATLSKAGLAVARRDVVNAEVAPGIVVGVEPAPGTSLTISAPVTLTVSSGPQMVLLPSTILGMTQAEAEAALQELGLRTDSAMQADDNVAEGLVISANPAPEASIPISSVVKLAVSSGRAHVTIAEVTNRPLAEAQKTLEDLKLTVVVTPVLDGAVDAGNVIRTEPAAGAPARVGDNVAIFVSAPRPTAAPTGMLSFFEGTECPAGWQERPEMKGRLLLGTTDGTYAGKISAAPPLADKEDRQHAHSFAGNLALPQRGIAAGGGGNNDGGQAGNYAINGTVAAVTSNLPFRQLLACEKKATATSAPATGDAYPKDTVSYVTSKTCPAGWEAYEAANGRFLLPLPAAGTTADVGNPIALTPSTVDISPHSHSLAFMFGIGNQSFVLAGGSDRNLGQSGGFQTGAFDTAASSAAEQLPYIALMVCRKVAEPQPAVDQIPSTVLAFTEAPACPTGWDENWISRGRFLVALPDRGTPGDFGGRPLDAGEDRQHTHNAAAVLNLRAEGISGLSGCCASGYARNTQYSATAATGAASMNVPYRQLRLCKPAS